MIHGTTQMPELFADSWDCQAQVMIITESLSQRTVEPSNVDTFGT